MDNSILCRLDRFFTEENKTPVGLKILLGSAIDSHRPIPAKLALQWVKNSRDYNIYFGAIARRYEDKFDELFMQKYCIKYAKGIVIDRKPGTELYLRYELASPGGKCFLKRIAGVVDIRHYNYCLVILQEIVSETTNLLEIRCTVTWHPKGEMVEIQGIKIPDGMVYTKSGVSNLRCVISTTLPISDSEGPNGPKKLDYWPSYSTGTNREQRKTYLTWLANGRDKPVNDIGYVFLFFYGLEQRYFEILENEDSEIEVEQIRDETKKLLKVYGHDSSLRMYANKFLNYIETHMPLKEEIDESELEKYIYFSSEIHETPTDLKMAIGSLICRGKPLSATIALAWLKNSEDYAAIFKTPARRCEIEFNELFGMKYREKYRDGFLLKLKPNTELKLGYNSASANLNVAETEIIGTVDIKYYYSYLNELQCIVNEVTDELDAYSRILTRKSGNSGEAELYLPEKLRNQKFAPLLEKLSREKGHYFLSEIMKILGVDKISKKTLPLAIDLLNSYGIAYSNDIGHQIIRGSATRRNLSNGGPGIAVVVQLNQEKIRELEEDTALVQNILAQEIFNEDSPKTSSATSIAKPNLSGTAIELFNHIIQQEEWTREELEKFAKDRKIMLDGVLEEINDNFTEAFIEIFDDRVYVNRELVKEINS
jgi:hypothetical protein